MLSSTKSTNISDDKYEKASNLVFHLVTYVSVTIGVVIGLNGIGKISFGYPMIGYLGISIMLIGIAFRRVAVKTLKQYFSVTLRIVEEHTIVQNGVYSLIRHPSYTGSLLIYIGLGIGLSSWLSFIIILVPMLAVLLHRIGIEEKMMIDHFGEEYLEYMGITWRLIPWLY